ncbi:MAG: vancomycin resistance protein, partial [Oribacterium parvum]|nr:vancomycin resistance protein [Oribacterium parvum]
MLASQRRLSREVNRAQGSSRSRSSSHTYSGKYSRTGRNSGRRPNNKAPFPAVAVGLLAIVVLGSGVFALTRSKSKTEETETVIETQAINPNAIQKDLYLDYSAFKKDAELLNLKGMTEEEVEDFLRKSYQWNIVIKNANPNIQYFSMPEFPEHKEN